MPPTTDAMIWDWPLRVFHWTLVACVAGSWATHYAGIEWFAWHRAFGCASLVLVLFRIAWGWVGTRHARFRSFVRGPRGIVAYLRDPASVPNSGHNPLGALSVLVFLAVLVVQASTGLLANDEIANAGPLQGWVDFETSGRLTSLHRGLSKALLGLIVLHVAAIAWHERRSGGGGLVRAMMTGRKPGVTDGIYESRGALAVLIVAVLAGALALVILAAPEASISYF